MLEIRSASGTSLSVPYPKNEIHFWTMEPSGPATKVSIYLKGRQDPICITLHSPDKPEDMDLLLQKAVGY